MPRPFSVPGVGFLLRCAYLWKRRFSCAFSLVLLGPKVPKASARRSPRECGLVVSPRAAKDINKDKYVSVTCALFFTPQGGSRLGFDGERAAGGLKARASGTVCLQTRAVARRRFQTFGRRHRNRSGGFCCFSLPKSREKEKVFSCTFGAKSTKSLRTSFSAGACDPRRCTGRARSSLCATPWRTRRVSYPLFSASNESAELLCRRRRQYNNLYGMRSGTLFSRMAGPDLVPMAKERPEG